MTQAGYTSDGSYRIFYTQSECQTVYRAVHEAESLIFNETGSVACRSTLRPIQQELSAGYAALQANRITTPNPSRDYLNGASLALDEADELSEALSQYADYRESSCVSGSAQAEDYYDFGDDVSWGDGEEGLTDWEQALYDELLSQSLGQSVTAEELGVDYAALDALIEDVTGGSIEELGEVIPEFVQEAVRQGISTGQLTTHRTLNRATLMVLGGLGLGGLALGAYLAKKKR